MLWIQPGSSLRGAACAAELANTLQNEGGSQRDELGHLCLELKGVRQGPGYSWEPLEGKRQQWPLLTPAGHGEL